MKGLTYASLVQTMNQVIQIFEKMFAVYLPIKLYNVFRSSASSFIDSLLLLLLLPSRHCLPNFISITLFTIFPLLLQIWKSARHPRRSREQINQREGRESREEISQQEGRESEAEQKAELNIELKAEPEVDEPMAGLKIESMNEIETELEVDVPTAGLKIEREAERSTKSRGVKHSAKGNAEPKDEPRAEPKDEPITGLDVKPKTQRKTKKPMPTSPETTRSETTSSEPRSEAPGGATSKKRAPPRKQQAVVLPAGLCCERHCERDD